MRQLTDAEVAKFATRKGAKRIAVENFLGTLDERAGLYGNRQNLYADARSYGWNAATFEAIRQGIGLAFRGA